MRIFNSQLNVLQRGLDASWLKGEVIANNIANADTPGFKASKVNFEAALRRHTGAGEGAGGMKRTSAKHMDVSTRKGSLESFVEPNTSTSKRLDGNNVDIEYEMVELAKNNLLYQALIQEASKELSKIKYAVNEGKR
ncbi:MAG: flagellar basal body rod protein FlgB [Eubacteriales bacterium]|nr:flagellar basal body rod protein FlgB [Eubacteriales bacterium]